MKKEQSRTRKKENLKKEELIIESSQLNLVSANRQLSSQWTVNLNIYLYLTLPDGRVLLVDQTKNLPAKQIGRRKKQEA